MNDIQTILENHLKWMYDDPDGQFADLRGVNLIGAKLRGVNLWHADLRGANLRGADLSNAILEGADLHGASLQWTDLRGANLYFADLSYANMFCANLRGANLHNAYISNADLSHAELDNVLNLHYPIACPEYGSFIGWKKANEHIVKLLITEDAKRCSAAGRKCRCSEAIVLAIENLDGSESHLSEVPSSYTPNFVYRVGETVSVQNFNDNRWNECSAGIHFFITRQEAVDY